MATVGLAAVGFCYPTLLPVFAPLVIWRVSKRAGVLWESEDWVRMGLVLGAVYLPFVWPASQGDCSHCRETWMSLFSVAPGMVPAHLGIRLLGFGRLPDELELTIAALATVALLVGLVLLARRGRVRLAVAMGFALLWSTVSALALDAAIRA
jgi:hypothetical protein